jgi:hypothetical protein
MWIGGVAIALFQLRFCEKGKAEGKVNSHPSELTQRAKDKDEHAANGKEARRTSESAVMPVQCPNAGLNQPGTIRCPEPLRCRTACS